MEQIPAVASTLSTTDIINVTLCILSFLLSAISVVAVVLTLRQNNKMIEASTRPYIVVSYEVFHPGGGPNTYLVVKNYGATGAQIVSFNCSARDDNYLDKQIPRIPGTYFAPGQRLLYLFKPSDFKEEIISFEYSYGDGKKTYTNSQEMRIKTGALNARSLSDSIPHTLQDIAERLL